MADDLVAAKVVASALPAGYVQVFGLVMPTSMYNRIIAAVRGVYPAEADGKTDAAAAQAALKRIIIDLVTTWEVSIATQPLPEILQKAADDCATQQRAAAQAAQDDGDTQIQPTVTA